MYALKKSRQCLDRLVLIDHGNQILVRFHSHVHLDGQTALEHLDFQAHGRMVPNHM